MSSPTSVSERFSAILLNEAFRSHDFYVFGYSSPDAICMFHWGNYLFLGRSLCQVFRDMGISLDADKLHRQFREAAQKGGRWVSYRWANSGETQAFEKISYIFQINIDGQELYEGAGFKHHRYPVWVIRELGERKTEMLSLAPQNMDLLVVRWMLVPFLDKL